jgi:transposase InsO family protein
MSNHVGSSTIYTTILPNNQALSRIHSVKLSREAKHRLRVIEYFLNGASVSLTCRHFGITRSYFYKWYKRYDPRHLASLESISTRPKRVRSTTYDYELVKLIRKLRQDYTRLSSKKLAVVLLRDYGINYSAATIGRIIQKFQLYFARIVRVSKARKAAVKAWVKRKPYNLKAHGPRQVIEFDMKHINSLGQRNYAFVAVDPFTKEALIHVAARPSSYQAKIALEQVLARFGKDICVVNDNGSENFKHAYDYLKDQDVTQYFARPHTPKDKPHVENLIGKLQQECLDENTFAKSVPEVQRLINQWLNDYHFFRPHQALNYLTPQEYCDTLQLTIPRVRVSTM